MNPNNFHEMLDFQIRLSYMSQKELALTIRVSQNTVSNWCRGISEPSLEHFFLMCFIFSRKQDVPLISIVNQFLIVYPIPVPKAFRV